MIEKDQRYHVKTALNSTLKAELRDRGFWVYKPFWRRYREQFEDRWYFWRTECRINPFYAFLFSL